MTGGGGRWPVAAVVYNNAAGGFSGTLGGTSSIPGIGMSQEDGQGLVGGSLGQTGSVSTIVDSSGYAYLDGTSMASPHVAGSAAIIWSANPSASNTQVRSAMTSTALDLGAAGRDNCYGNGLVQTFDATEALFGGGGGTDPDPVAAPTGRTASNNGTGKGTLQIGLACSAGAVTVMSIATAARSGRPSATSAATPIRSRCAAVARSPTGCAVQAPQGPPCGPLFLR